MKKLVKLILLFNILALVLSQETWNTLYSLTKGKIYLHLKNNDLISLNFSISGFDDINKYESAELDYSNNDRIKTLPSPPDNSSLLLINDNLYAFAGTTTSHDQDVCGDGVLTLYRFDDSSSSWEKFSKDLNFDSISDASYYQHATYLTTPTNNNTIYIFGGYCDSQGQATDRLLSLDLTTFEFHNISTSTKPQSFYGASNLLAPNPQSQLVIGGESNNGWLNMYQLAEWNFEAGWTSNAISKGDIDSISSRKFSLTLPVFSILANNSVSTISDYYNVKEVLLIGGEASSGSASPKFAKLSLDSNDWVWNSVNATLDYDEILGAATIFNTLVIINSTTVKRDSQSYTMNLYDVNSFSPVSNLKDNFASLETKASSKDSSSSVKKKAILGSVIPICVIAIAAVGTLFFIKRRQRSKVDELESIDYQFGNYYDQQSLSKLLGIGHRKINSDISKDKFGYNHVNDSNSTLDAASIDSWFKKRQEFDEKRLKTLKRNSYLASNETLNEPKMSYEIPSSPPFAAVSNIEENPFETLLVQKSAEVYDDEEPDKPLPSPPQVAHSRPHYHPYHQLSQEEDGFVNRSVSKIKKSFSFTNTPPPSTPRGYLKSKKSGNLPRTALADQIEGPSDYHTHHHHVKSVDIAYQEDPENYESDSIGSLDDKMDVQVLVSSKRRSKLRVVNPDLDDVDEERSEIDLSNASIRKRVPSWERNKE